jgi:hypothetical protein
MQMYCDVLAEYRKDRTVVPKKLATAFLWERFIKVTDKKLKNAIFWVVTPCGYIPEDGILHSHRRGNLKSYTAFTG